MYCDQSRLEKRSLFKKERAEYNERAFLIALTYKGEAPKHDALSMQDLIGLSNQEMISLRLLPNKALVTTESKGD